MFIEARTTRLRGVVGSAAVLIAATLAVADVPTTAEAAPAGQVLYSPDLGTYTDGDASYPRAIRLGHDGSGGQTMLATFARRNHGGPGDLPVYRSTDGGQTWSSSPISTITSNTPGWDLGGPVIYEVPANTSGLDAGDLYRR